jgi:hypothetical protein
MKILNMSEEVATISNYLVDDPEWADYLLVTYSYAIEPLFYPLRNHTLNKIKHYNLQSLSLLNSTTLSSLQQQGQKLDHHFQLKSADT